MDKATLWATRSILQHAITAIISIILEILSITLGWIYNQSAYGNNIGRPTIFFTQGILYMILHIHLVLLARDAMRTMNTLEVSGLPVLRSSFIFFMFTQVNFAGQFKTCADSWLSLTDSADPATISTNLYKSFDFVNCPSPSNILVTSTMVSVPSMQTSGSLVDIPLLSNIDQSRTSIASAQHLLPMIELLSILATAVNALGLLVTIWVTIKSRQALSWHLYHEYGASIQRRSMLFRIQTIQFLIKVKTAMIFVLIPFVVVAIVTSSQATEVATAILTLQINKDDLLGQQIAVLVLGLLTIFTGPPVITKALYDHSIPLLRVYFAILLVQSGVCGWTMYLIVMDEHLARARLGFLFLMTAILLINIPAMVLSILVIRDIHRGYRINLIDTNQPADVQRMDIE
ncbi:hypothetical protein BC831DRAFT_550582 [Entophlyctis helioformis]|nr:hypothetical protein BC831DRAFT_550582 [Entophlyctis helioformis]